MIVSEISYLFITCIYVYVCVPIKNLHIKIAGYGMNGQASVRFNDTIIITDNILAYAFQPAHLLLECLEIHYHHQMYLQRL
jgi:hypothetical protein